jgi:hypothetical protein
MVRELDAILVYYLKYKDDAEYGITDEEQEFIVSLVREMKQVSENE